MSEMKLLFYGVRGSYPVPDKRAAKFGGNTSSILIEIDNQPFILDAGTGIINIGDYLIKKKPNLKKIDIFLTHYHIDHIQGLPFFKPMYDNRFQVNIYGYEDPRNTLEESIYALFNPPLSPIGKEGIKAKINFKNLDTNHNETIRVGNAASLDYVKEAHPISGVLVYRITVDNARIVYATDVESPQGFSKETFEFIKGADVLIHDSMYFEKDYNSETFSKKGFGHSTVSMAAANAINGEVKKLYLFHYNPDYSDKEILKMHQEAKKIFKNTYLSKEIKGFKLRR